MHDVALIKNDLLAELSADAYAALMPKFERVELKFRENLYGQGDIFSHVYFVESGIISVLASDDEHTTMEVAMIGREGMAPPPLFLGVTKSTCCGIVQGEGFALRMPADEFMAECAANDDLSRIMRRFTYSIIVQLTRSAICNRFHSTSARLARWLLMTGDRMRSADFMITQEFLSYMVGVRREAVNKAASAFQRSGHIKYARGHMTILDRKALEAISCTCYGVC